MKYMVMLRGENFELNYEGETVNFGFFTTRIVKALNEKQAELAAVELVKTDNKLLDTLVKDRKFEPMIYLEEMCQAKWWKSTGGSGFSFFDMEEEQDETEDISN
ncbi:MAG: hypothetical protein GY781_12915 [Gammaproteobacteria bacterium]|nr:hypothetical protein [Gammaproteobacteria bacterium]